MIFDFLISIASSKMYEELKKFIDRKSLQKLIETLKQKTIEFERRNDGTIIVSSQFNNYVNNYNVLFKIMEHVLQPDISKLPKAIFVDNMTENIITYCEENGYKPKVTDKNITKGFVEMIYSIVENFAKNKVNPDDRYLIYTIIQTKGSIELQLKEVKDELQQVRNDFCSDKILLKLTDEWFKEQNQIAIKNLGDRYLPQINVSLEISDVFEGIARSNKFKKKFITNANDVLISLNNIKEEKVSKYIHKLTEIIHKIPFNNMDYFDFNIIINLLNKVIDEIKNIEKDVNKNSTSYDYKLYKIRQAYHNINNFMDYLESKEIELFNNPILLIQGEGGIGKSHLIADVVSKRCEENKKSILLLGQQFNAYEEPWKQICNFLGLNTSADELLDSLNIIGKNQKSRLIIFIDAINEGGGKDLWPNYLAGVIEKIKKYEYLGLVLSIRTTYLKAIIGDNEYLNDSLVKITHYGFRNVEYAAMKKFFEFYKIPQPNVPLMNPEFSNPLFLLLFCKSVENNVDFISDISISTVFDNYIKKINYNLSKKYNYYEYIPFVKSVIEEIVKYRISNNCLNNYIKIDKIIDLIIKSQKKYNIEGNVIEGLISEGILTKNISYDGEDYIYITYEKLEEHMVVSYIVDDFSIDNIRKLIKDEKIRNRQGIIEALAIQAPEKINMEIYELLADSADSYDTIMAFINSLHWRKEDSIKDKVIDYVNECVRKYKGTFEEFWNTIILLSIRPKHPFNAKRTFRTLYSIQMPDRDAIFVPLFNGIYNDDTSSISRLIDWAMLDEDKEQISDDVIECAAIMLSWFLCTPNRNFRDCCTKAIINLLTHRSNLVTNLLNMFKDIDDPYIKERLYAIAYGCAVKETNIENLKQLSLFVYDNIFNKDEVYPHILLRDYARNIIEYTIYKGVELNIDINKIKPPYKSTFPSIPADNEIKKYKYDYNSESFKDYYWSQNRILNSMKVEYSRDGKPGGYGDFGRYTFQSYFKSWKQLHPIDLMNIAIKRIFDLGYDVEKHGKYDWELERRIYSTDFESNERIGKKYQWIALHELAAQVSDNYTMVAPWSWRNREQIFCPGSFEPCIRDIDPTVIIKKDRIKPKFFINVSQIYKNFDIENELWLKDFSDVPNIAELINLPIEKNKWLLLDGFYNWTELTEIGRKKYDYPQKNFWISIKSYIVKSKEFNSIIEQLKNINFMEIELPECSEGTSLFNREYYYSTAYDFFKKDYYNGVKWREIIEPNKHNILGKVMVPVERYFREMGNDYSTEDGFGWYKPCEDIIKDLGLKYGDENSALYDYNNNLICFDTMELCNEELGFLINKESLFKFLNLNDYKIFWTVLGEKRIFSATMLDKQVYSIPTFSGVYYITDSGLDGNITEFDE
ncbi:hypothetical protein [Petroclostridium xylanilyticum]|uniref:hypothetical protein n=1 Tax=Petroclostridium xylanilyticum TaxID=1792311 RepID=UPI000B982134|nr:hypothetical protein [Petroclostridium xylanilyticum]